MIAKMSKIEIVGEKALLQDVLSQLQDMGIFQLDPAALEGKEESAAYAPDERIAFEKLFLEDLRQKIHELLSRFPSIPVRESYIRPQAIIGTIAYTVERHLATCRSLRDEIAVCERERSELARYVGFLSTLESLSRMAHVPPDIDVIGLTLKDTAYADRLRGVLSKLTGGRFKFFTVPAGDGTLTGLITVDKHVSEAVSTALNTEQIPEMSFPPSFGDLPLSAKIVCLEDRAAGLSSRIEAVKDQIKTLCRRWQPIYHGALQGIDERLSVLTAAAAVYRTKMCFFIKGWMPSRDLGHLRDRLSRTFGGKIVVEEKEIREQDLERIPSDVRNPAYFRPFELFTRLLPLPAYTSYDPTPFIGIFFPIFFGLILGDAGYGLVLAVAALIALSRGKVKPLVRDGARILLTASLYSIFFGVLFGEFFGDLPRRLFGLEPILIERSTAIIPMFLFALTIGVFHVLLGLLLGAITAFRKKTRREAAYKILSILIILGMMAVLASAFGVFPGQIARPVVMGILIMLPFLIFSGGLLAPLELLKSIGNIISYVRITAIGLTSVLLAMVANQLAGLTGDVVLGVVVAGLLHMLNIILGVFSPTIHSLRLHYVEFFSKFIESGGRKFEPLKK